MTSILTSITGQFSKSLILGTLLPVVVFLILGAIFVVPLFPYDWYPLKRLISLESETIATFSFLAVVFSGLLYSFNTTIRNFYEGYPWRKTLVGQWRIRQYQKQLRDARTFMARTVELRNEMQRRDPEKYGAWISRLENERTTVGERVNTAFPSESNLVLPTRLGNVLRSFEKYAFRQYKMGEILWPRLRGKLDKEFAAALDEAKTPLDFVINISFLSGVLSFTIFVIGLWYPIAIASRRTAIWWVMEIFGFAFLSYFAYTLAINQSTEWGNMFRSAFDLYRWDLLRQLGYQLTPANINEERALWGGIYRQLQYGDPPGARMTDYTRGETFTYGYLSEASVEPFMVGLSTSRGISLPDDRGVIVVTLRVRNEDGQRRKLWNVVLRDTIPEQCDYLWETAKLGHDAASVSGSNPYYFEMEDLDFEEEKTITYEMWRKAKS